MRHNVLHFINTSRTSVDGYILKKLSSQIFNRYKNIDKIQFYEISFFINIFIKFSFIICRTVKSYIKLFFIQFRITSKLNNLD